MNNKDGSDLPFSLNKAIFVCKEGLAILKAPLGENDIFPIFGLQKNP